MNHTDTLSAPLTHKNTSINSTETRNAVQAKQRCQPARRTLPKALKNTGRPRRRESMYAGTPMRSTWRQKARQTEVMSSLPKNTFSAMPSIYCEKEAP